MHISNPFNDELTIKLCLKNKLIEMHLITLFAVTLMAICLNNNMIEMHLIILLCRFLAICLKNKLIEMHLIILFCCYTRGSMFNE